MLLINEVIGRGEVPIADHRSTAPSLTELARVVKDVHVGGILTGKAGVTHFMSATRPRSCRISAACSMTLRSSLHGVYPHARLKVRGTHARSSRAEPTWGYRGRDVIERDLAKWIRVFVDAGGSTQHPTASSDAAISSPRTLFDQVRACIRDEGLPAELILPMVTTNPANVLRLAHRHGLKRAQTREALEIRQVIARGRHVVKDGCAVVDEKYLEVSARKDFMVDM